MTDLTIRLCRRKGCVHYRSEHNGPGGACTGPGRGPDGFMIPGTQCSCPQFLEKRDD